MYLAILISAPFGKNLRIQVRSFASSEILGRFFLGAVLIILRNILSRVQFLHVIIYFRLVKLFSAITNTSSVLVRSNENMCHPHHASTIEQLI